MASELRLNVRNTSRYLGKPERTIRHWCRTGRLEGAKQDEYHHKWLVSLGALRRIRARSADPTLEDELYP